MSSLPLFLSRADAGRRLAERLVAHARTSETIVLALVRGGVAVGRGLADALGLPLYPYVVRKLGHPENPEFAVGAIAENGATFLDEPLMREMDLTWTNIEPIAEAEMREMQRRKDAYLIGARPPIRGKAVILVDDGAATGATMFAAIEDIRNLGVDRVTVALPVAPPDTAAKLRARADDAIFLATPAAFRAVGQFYDQFDQLTDEEVLSLLSTTIHPYTRKSPSSDGGGMVPTSAQKT